MPFQFQIVQYSWEVSNCCFRVPGGGREKEQQEKQTPGRQYLLLAQLVTNDSLCLLPTLKQGESHRSVNTQESKKTDLTYRRALPTTPLTGHLLRVRRVAWKRLHVGKYQVDSNPQELFHGNLAQWEGFQTTCGIETDSLEAEPQPSHLTSGLPEGVFSRDKFVRKCGKREMIGKDDKARIWFNWNLTSAWPPGEL